MAKYGKMRIDGYFKHQLWGLKLYRKLANKHQLPDDYAYEVVRLLANLVNTTPIVRSSQGFKPSLIWFLYWVLGGASHLVNGLYRQLYMWNIPAYMWGCVGYILDFTPQPLSGMHIQHHPTIPLKIRFRGDTGWLLGRLKILALPRWGSHRVISWAAQLVTDLCTLRDFTNNIWGFCGTSMSWIWVN